MSSSSNTPKTSHFFTYFFTYLIVSLLIAAVMFGLFGFSLSFLADYIKKSAENPPHVELEPTIVTNLVPKTGFGSELHGNISYVTRKGFNGGIAPLFDPGSSDLGEQWDLIKKVVANVPDPTMLPPITIQVVSREFVLVGTNMVPYHGQAGFRTTLPAGIIVTYPPGSQFR